MFNNSCVPLLFISTTYLFSLVTFLFIYSVGFNFFNFSRALSASRYSVIFFGLLFVCTFLLNYSLFYKISAFSLITDPIILPFFLVFILVTPITLLYAYKYRSDEVQYFFIFTFFIIFIGLGLFAVDSLIIFFFLYEALLLPSFFILYLFAKTRKAVEAAFLMFF